jgi:hypothetical protein
MPKRSFSIVLAVLLLASLVAVPAVAVGAAEPGTPPTPSTPGHRAAVDAPAVPGQFVIRWQPGTPATARAATIRAEGGRLFGRIADLGADAVEFPALAGRANPTGAAALIARLKRNPNVALVEPNYIYSVRYTPNDPGLGQQYAWGTIQAAAAWDTTQGS